MLNFLAHHVYSGRYGTFLFDSDYTRDIYQARSKTVSIWTDILGKRRTDFINVFYDHYNTERLNPIYPNFAMYKIRLWEEYFLKYYIPPSLDNNPIALPQHVNTYTFHFNMKTKFKERLSEQEDEKSKLRRLLVEIHEKCILKDIDFSEETREYFKDLEKTIDKISI